MTAFKRILRTSAGRLLTWSSLLSFITSLIVGPGPAEAITAGVQDAALAYHGTHRSLTSVEMKSIEGAATAGSADPWEVSDKNLGGYGSAKVGDGNETVSIPVVGYNGRGLSVNMALAWNYAAGGGTNPCGAGWTHSYNLYAWVNPGYGDVTLHEADGRARLYTYSSGTYIPPVGIHDVLIKNADGSFTLTRKNQVQYHYSSAYSDSTFGQHLDWIKDTNGNQVTVAYGTFTVGGSSVYQATSVTDPTGRALTLGYDTSSRLSSITDPLTPTARVWTLSYDTSGNLTQVTTPRVIGASNTTYLMGYTSGYLSSFQDRRGHTWTLAYGSIGSITGVSSVTDPYTHSRSYSWNPYQKYMVSDENGNYVSYSLDGSNRLTGIEIDIPNGSGMPTWITVDTKSWDSSNNLSSDTDGNSNTTNFTWDSNGNKLTAVAPLMGGVHPTTTWTYNSHNDCTSVQTPLGYTTTLTWNATDNLTNVQDALGHNTVYTVNSYGQVTGIQDANGTGHSETIAYDSNGNVSSVTDADSHTTAYAWDSVSRLTQRTDARSNITTYSPDVDNNVTTITYPGSVTVTASFDANDNKTGMTDSHGNWSWVFDNDNRLTSATDPNSHTVSYSLDNGGRITQTTRPDSTTINYGYDGGNRLTSVTDTAISTTATTLGYDNNSNLTSQTLSNGATVAKTYDALERLTAVTNKNSSGTVLSSYTYSLDNDSEKTGVTEANGDTMSWSYDHLHRLTGEVRTGANAYSYSYTMDNAGNRSTWTNNNTLASTSYSYDAANHMTAAGSTSYGYDADGNRTSVTSGGTTTTFTFDYEDRLTGIGANTTYSYIGASTDRFSKTVSGTTTNFLYEGGSVTEEMQGTTVTADYGADAEKLSGTVYWMLQDGQPSTRQLLNSSQAIVSAYTTDAFGNNLSSTGTAANPFKWNGGSGYYSDSESGIQKVGARYYDPGVGSWISQDTMLIAGSVADSQAVNRYLYCGANPVGRLDPSGHSPLVFVVVFILGCILVWIAISSPRIPPPETVTEPVDPVDPDPNTVPRGGPTTYGDPSIGPPPVIPMPDHAPESPASPPMPTNPIGVS